MSPYTWYTVSPHVTRTHSISARSIGAAPHIDSTIRGPSRLRMRPNTSASQSTHVAAPVASAAFLCAYATLNSVRDTNDAFTASITLS